MSETKEVEQLFREFEEKFGFKTYDGLKYYWGLIYKRMQKLEISRDKWRKKFEDLVAQNKQK